MTDRLDPARAVLVTGASGLVGRRVVALLAEEPGTVATIVALDLAEVADDRRVDGVEYLVGDIRDPDLEGLLRGHGIDTVVHLAAIVTPGRDSSREHEFSVDVLGTQNVLECALRAGVGHIIYTSSGAAYGYHADNPVPLREGDALRGNPEFAYSDHKRQVEEMLAGYRVSHPGLEQVVLRVGTILGERTSNQITALFERARLLKVRGSPSPFVFVWDQDVVGAIEHAIFEGPPGIYNVAGDGALTIDEIAARLGRRCVEIPAWALRAALAAGKALRLTQYGPEQVNFLRYRPVLDNRRLKEVFGYVPKLTSAQVFDLYRKAHGAAR